MAFKQIGQYSKFIFCFTLAVLGCDYHAQDGEGLDSTRYISSQLALH